MSEDNYATWIANIDGKELIFFVERRDMSAFVSGTLFDRSTGERIRRGIYFI
jgi:hypothetical protein